MHASLRPLNVACLQDRVLALAQSPGWDLPVAVLERLLRLAPKRDGCAKSDLPCFGDRGNTLAAVLNQLLVEGLGIPPGDRFILLSEHKSDELYVDPTFLGMKRSADAMIITVHFGAHRPLDDKRKLTSAISRLASEAVAVSPDDIFIALIPVPNENFSFGQGELQLAGAPPRW